MDFTDDLTTRIALFSDAAIYALIGAGFIALAGLCLLMEWRRNKSRSLERLERVGWVPWTPLFVTCAMIGGGILALSLPVVIGNL